MFSWFPFLTYAVVTTSTPGPNTLMSMSNGTQLGFRRALPFNFGILAGFSLVMVLCTLLCSTLSAMLENAGYPVSRRTVTKYREILGISNAFARKYQTN